MEMQHAEALARVLKSAEPCPGLPGHRSYEVAKNQRTQWAYDCLRVADLLVQTVPGLTRHDFLVMCGAKEAKGPPQENQLAQDLLRALVGLADWCDKDSMPQDDDCEAAWNYAVETAARADKILNPEVKSCQS